MGNNPFQNTMGGLAVSTQWPQTYPSTFTTPAPPSWEQIFEFQRNIMQLQQEVIRLQARLDKITNVKDWLVGPDNDSLNQSGGKTP